MKCVFCGYEPREEYLYLDDFETIEIKYKDKYGEQQHKTIKICPSCGIVFVNVKKEEL